MTKGKHRFDPETDVPDLAGKVYVVTGGSAGIGFGVAAHLLQHNAARIYLLDASEERLTEAAAGLRAYGDPGRVERVRVDPADLHQTDGAARQLAARLQTDGRLDGLLLHAGVGGGGGGGAAGPYAETRDGLEQHMQAEGFAPHRLARALLPALAATPGSRLVAQASQRHRRAPGRGRGAVAFDGSVAEVNEDLGAGALRARAALAPLLLGRALARRKAQGALGLVPGGPPRILATHPGDTALAAALRPFLGDPLREAGRAMLFAATSPAVADADFPDGCYIGPDCKLAEVGKQARDDELGERLWRLAEEILREKLK